MNILGIGVLGEYLGRTYAETKQRPLYVVADAVNVDDLAAQPVTIQLAGRHRCVGRDRLLVAQTGTGAAGDQLVPGAVGDLLEGLGLRQRVEGRQRHVLVLAVQGHEQPLGGVGDERQGGQADAASHRPPRHGANQPRRRDSPQRGQADGLGVARAGDDGEIALVVQAGQGVERLGLVAAVGGQVHQELAGLGADAFIHVAAGDGGQRADVLDAGNGTAPHAGVRVFTREAGEDVLRVVSELVDRLEPDGRVGMLPFGLPKAIEEGHDNTFSGRNPARLAAARQNR